MPAMTRVPDRPDPLPAVVRPAAAGDLPAIVALQEEIAAEGSIRGYRPDPLEDWLARDLSWTWVATTATGVAGMITCRERPFAGECVFPSGSRILEIVDLFVTRAHRQHGIGRRLVATAQDAARSRGYTHLRLLSAAVRFDDITAFYRQLGFTPWYLEMTAEL